MIIGACGFGATGSSVVTDYLKEFDCVTVKDDLEFTYVTANDSLLYLEERLMHPHGRTEDSIYGFSRFEGMVQRSKRKYQIHGLSPECFEESARKFLDSITMTKWYWEIRRRKKGSRYSIKNIIRWYYINKVIPKYEKKHGKRWEGWPLDEVRLSVMPSNFYEAAQTHVDELLKGVGLDQNNIIALDQPFSGANPQACFPFFHDPYAVVVDRDPRDLYVFGKTKLMGKMHFFPIDTVEDFIIYYRSLRKDRPYLEPNPRVLCVRFEDMVYEYEKTMPKLREFLHLPENPRPKSVFDPDLSIANTQVFRRFPQFADDVKKIEKELSEYCFDFSKYPEPDFNKKMFYGKSPKHSGFKKKFGEDGFVPQSK